MATLRQAEAARSQFADRLAQWGAHAIGVEESGSEEGFVLIAYVAPRAKFSAPKTLTAAIGKKRVAVPVKVRRENMARPE